MIIIKKIIKDIYKKIKYYDEIIIARHVGPDPDAIASEIALRDSIRITFPDKKVYAVGAGVSKFRYYGNLDRINENDVHNPLLIVLDVPNLHRIDGYDYKKAGEIIKIDHHPIEDVMGDISWTDDTSSSTCQLIAELIINSKLHLNKKIAENLFMGIVSDSDRFLLSYTTPRTLQVVAKLIELENLDITVLYNALYERPLNEIRFQGFIATNMKVTENGFASIKISDEDIKKYEVDTATASNMVNNFNYIKEVVVWCFVTYDLKNNVYKVNVRSRGPIINEIAAKYNGGGHKFASGARITNEEDVEKLFNDLDECCKIYKKGV